jgi:hypothetical protein
MRVSSEALRVPKAFDCHLRTTADKVDEFESVSLMEAGVCPAVSGNNVAIQFNGDAIGLHAERFDESGQGQNLGIESSFLSIDVEFHNDNLRDLGREFAGRMRPPTTQLFGFAQNEFSGGRAALEIGLNQQRSIR